MKLGRLSAYSTLLGCALALSTLSCSSDSSSAPAAATYPATPFAVVTTDVGGYSVATRTEPGQPPPAGLSTVELTITDSTGAPVDGLTIDTLPWMPVMGHGASVTPTTVPKGNGVYILTDVDMFMAGTWDLHFTITGPMTAHATVTFQIT